MVEPFDRYDPDARDQDDPDWIWKEGRSPEDPREASTDQAGQWMPRTQDRDTFYRLLEEARGRQ